MKTIQVKTNGRFEAAKVLLNGITLYNKTQGDWSNLSTQGLEVCSRVPEQDATFVIKSYDVELKDNKGTSYPVSSSETLDDGTVVRTYNITTNYNTSRGGLTYRKAVFTGSGGKRIDILSDQLDINIQGTAATGYINPWTVSSGQLSYSNWKDEMANCVIKNVDGELDLGVFEGNTGMNYVEFHSTKVNLVGDINSLANSYETLHVLWIGNCYGHTGNVREFFDLLKAKGLKGEGGVARTVDIYFVNTNIVNDIPGMAGIKNIRASFDDNGDWTPTAI